MIDARGSLSEAAPHDVQATFCATLIDQWIASGVSHAVVAPGSRSTPMAVALTARHEMSVHVVHDERVAAFIALGLGLSGTPALLLCTSGTAAANFFPAVVEAGLSEIGMIVLTADRPEELRNVGAPQTIDQIDLYGRHVRWSLDADVASTENSVDWRSIANTAWSESATGPVQLNLAFREPLLGTAAELPASLDVPTRQSASTAPDAVPAAVSGAKGVVLVGSAHGLDPDAVLALGAASGWPIIADPLSGMRPMSDIASVDALMRSTSFIESHVPDVIIRVGRPSTSKVLAQWTASCGATMIQVGGPGRIDPDHNVAAVCDMASVIDAIGEPAPRSWLRGWITADARAAAAIQRTIEASPELSEPAVARVLVDEMPAGSRLTVSSSMPVRDLEWFGGSAAAAHCNRGANGIDGVMSTAVGRALSAVGDAGDAAADFVLIGDLAFVHDSNALVALASRGVDLRVVVVDNDGGGIFSFLPQASELAGDRFEQLFGTPLGTDVLALAAAHGLRVSTATTPDALAAQIATPGPWVCRVPSTRSGNVAVHEALHAAAVAAIDDIVADS